MAYIIENSFSYDSFERLRQNNEIEEAHVWLPLLFINESILPGLNIFHKILLIVFFIGGGMEQEKQEKKIFIKSTDLHILDIFMEYG